MRHILESHFQEAWRAWCELAREANRARFQRRVAGAQLLGERKVALTRILTAQPQGKRERFLHWKRCSVFGQQAFEADRANTDIARLLHDKAMLMRMVRDNPNPNLKFKLEGDADADGAGPWLPARAGDAGDRRDE